MMKLGAGSAEQGAALTTALTATPTELLSVWEVIKAHKTLTKLAGADAAGFAAKAKDLFPMSTYFAGI